MSYILDALRRAEADRERERGQVPGLHTQALAGSEAAPAAGQRRWLPWAGAGLLLLTGLGAGIWWASDPHEAPSPVAAPMTVAAPVMPTAPAASQTATQAEVQPTAQTAISVPTLQPAASGSPYLAPQLPRSPAPGAVAAAPAPRPGSVAAPVPLPATEARIPLLSELPESTRREMPKLAISGSVYSDNPAVSFVIVNGEVLREGAKLGADLVLEQIRPHELVLRFRGQRYLQPV
jgi:general secretion pathway protein B